MIFAGCGGYKTSTPMHGNRESSRLEYFMSSPRGTSRARVEGRGYIDSSDDVA